MVNQKYLDKAEVLIEALPYIQRFNRKIVVVKYGGSAMLKCDKVPRFSEVSSAGCVCHQL